MDLVYGFSIFLAFYLVGDKLREWWGFEVSIDAEAFVFSTALGLAAVSLAVTFLAVSSLIYPATAYILLAAIFAGRASRVQQLFVTLRKKLQSPKTSSPTETFDTFNNWILGILIITSLTLALAPPTATDALVYHLAVPKAYLQHHGIVNLPNNIYSFFPQQLEMIYLFCLMLKGDALAQLAGLGMTLITLFAMTVFYKRYLSGRYTSLVAVLFFATPTIWSISSTAYVDIAAAGFIFLAFYAWDRWRVTKHEGWFLTMITFAACATATKLTAVLALPLIFLGIVLQGRKQGDLPQTLRKILLFTIVTIIFLGPWLTRNFHYTGNPFVPFLMQFFDNEEGINWDSHRASLQFQYYQSFGMGRGLQDFLLLPVNLAFFSEKDSLRFDGQAGILYLLLLPCLFWLRRAKSFYNTSGSSIISLAILFTVFLVAWFTQSQYIRLLIPSLIFLSLLTVRGFEEMMQTITSKPTATFIHCILAAGILYNLSLASNEWVRKHPLQYLSGTENRNQYMARNIPSYPMFRAINDTLEKNVTVLFVYMRNLGYLCDRKFISDTFFEAYTLKKALGQAPSIDKLTSQLESMGVTHLLFDDRYVFGKDTAFTAVEREVLKKFLRTRAKRIKEEKGFYLYSL